MQGARTLAFPPGFVRLDSPGNAITPCKRLIGFLYKPCLLSNRRRPPTSLPEQNTDRLLSVFISSLSVLQWAFASFLWPRHVVA